MYTRRMVRRSLLAIVGLSAACSPPRDVEARLAPPIAVPVRAEEPSPTPDAEAPRDAALEGTRELPPDDAGGFESKCDGVALVIVSVFARDGRLVVNAELRNNGGRAVPLMTSGDGSSEDMRNPTVSFLVSPDTVLFPGRCAEVDSLAPADFVTLAPGASKRLEDVFPPTPTKPGLYSVRASYLNDPMARMIRSISRGSDPKLLKRGRKTTPCRLVSKPFSFEWK